MPIRVTKIEPVFKGWGGYSIATLELGTGETITREFEDHGSAVAVLPFDPVRKTALLVRQFRTPVFVKEATPDLLECVAGLREGPDPEKCAMREALEEVGVRLSRLEHVARVWAMPGISTEQMDLFLAPYEAADRVAAGGGLAEEHENITVVEAKLADLAAMADAGEIVDMKTLALVQTLRLRRPDLF